MTHALPVLWRQYVTELRMNRKLATKSITTYETGWNSLMVTARLMGWRLRTTEDITYDRLIEWQAALGDDPHAKRRYGGTLQDSDPQNCGRLTTP